jgi:hypothetical protein
MTGSVEPPFLTFLLISLSISTYCKGEMLPILSVPLGAMISGLEALKQYSLDYFSDSEKTAIAPYFDHLITVMKKF